RLGGDDRRVVTQEAVLVVVALLGRWRGERFGAFGPVEKTFAGGLAPAAEQILVVDEPAAMTEARRTGLDALRRGGEVGERRGRDVLPKPKRIHAEEAVGKFVESVDDAELVAAGDGDAAVGGDLNDEGLRRQGVGMSDV